MLLYDTVLIYGGLKATAKYFYADSFLYWNYKPINCKHFIFIIFAIKSSNFTVTFHEFQEMGSLEDRYRMTKQIIVIARK